MVSDGARVVQYHICHDSFPSMPSAPSRGDWLPYLYYSDTDTSVETVNNVVDRLFDTKIQWEQALVATTKHKVTITTHTHTHTVDSPYDNGYPVMTGTKPKDNRMSNPPSDSSTGRWALLNSVGCQWWTPMFPSLTGLLVVRRFVNDGKEWIGTIGLYNNDGDNQSNTWGMNRDCTWWSGMEGNQRYTWRVSKVMDCDR